MLNVLSLRWAHTHFVGFVMSWLKCLFSDLHQSNNKEYLSRLMTTPTMWLCAHRRLRSAWPSAQSDQNLRCALIG